MKMKFKVMIQILLWHQIGKRIILDKLQLRMNYRCQINITQFQFHKIQNLENLKILQFKTIMIKRMMNFSHVLLWNHKRSKIKIFLLIKLINLWVKWKNQQHHYHKSQCNKWKTCRKIKKMKNQILLTFKVNNKKTLKNHLLNTKKKNKTNSWKN